MSRRALGASVFLDSLRRTQQQRELLSRLREQGFAIRLREVLDALDIEDAAARSEIAELESGDFEIVVMRRPREPAREFGQPPRHRDPA